MGQRNGKGLEVTYPNGDNYKGDFVNGQREGEGLYISKEGHRYEGMWKNDMRHGAGTLTFASSGGKDGAKWAGSYEGEWHMNKKEGRGIFSYPNGDRYEGEWKDGKKVDMAYIAMQLKNVMKANF